jgi:hypothetical protein
MNHGGKTRISVGEMTRLINSTLNNQGQAFTPIPTHNPKNLNLLNRIKVHLNKRFNPLHQTPKSPLLMKNSIK